MWIKTGQVRKKKKNQSQRKNNFLQIVKLMEEERISERK